MWCVYMYKFIIIYVFWQFAIKVICHRYGISYKVFTHMWQWIHYPCFLHAKPLIPGSRKIDIHGCYSLVKIAVMPICACKNNRRGWHHNASSSHSRDVTYWTAVTPYCQVRKDRPWWKWRNKQSMIVLAGVCARSVHEIMCKKEIMHGLP